ncbi:hypothetical protein M0802_006345 [Mischocyttarus mexicanus]|nr:hypothetical protein M0802_006345 [Mischocyttarus mexicanus]
MEIVPCTTIIQTLLYQTLQASTTHSPTHQPTNQPTNYHLGLLPVVRFTLFRPIPTALLLVKWISLVSSYLTKVPLTDLVSGTLRSSGKK